MQQSSLAFNRDFLRRYLRIAPAALALERTMECEILSEREFARPVLDIGCGDGVFAKILFLDMIDVGIDPDSSEVAKAESLNAYSELIVCGAAAVPKPDNSFHTIFSNSVLEHIPDIDPVLKEIHRLLIPGGRFYVTIPTEQWERTVVPSRLLGWVGLTGLAARYANFYNWFWNHYRALPITNWMRLFETAGFKVVDHRAYSPPNMTTLLDVLTPFAAPAFISKKILGRWIPVDGIRVHTSRILYPALSAAARKAKNGRLGGLVFLELTK